jgi:hypothetical protein
MEAEPYIDEIGVINSATGEQFDRVDFEGALKLCPGLPLEDQYFLAGHRNDRWTAALRTCKRERLLLLRGTLVERARAARIAERN